MTVGMLAKLSTASQDTDDDGVGCCKIGMIGHKACESKNLDFFRSNEESRSWNIRSYFVRGTLFAGTPECV